LNVNLVPPITITLSSGFLVSEGDGVGTVQFRIQEQPVFLALTSTQYVWDTPFAIGDRVRMIQPYSAFGIGSEGILESITIDSTDDKAIVFFDLVVPNNEWIDLNTIRSRSGSVTIKATVPLIMLEKV